MRPPWCPRPSKCTKRNSLPEEGVTRIDPAPWNRCCCRALPAHQGHPLVEGLPALSGAASGQLSSTPTGRDARRSGTEDHPGSRETKPEDIHGFFASQGILTSRGGKTSHAAVVARGMGKPWWPAPKNCHRRPCATVRRRQWSRSDVITIDGCTGEVYSGRDPDGRTRLFERLFTLSAGRTQMAGLTCARMPTPRKSSPRSQRYGAKGIGLCRTERMFNAADRLPIVIRHDRGRNARSAAVPLWTDSPSDSARGLRRHLHRRWPRIP